jgi:hypothetical protein
MRGTKMMDKENPPPAERRRISNRTGFAGNYGSTHRTKPRQPQLITVTVVNTIIGRAHIVQQTMRHIHDPDMITFEFWPRLSGPRKGQRRWVRVRGANLNKRVSIRRFRDATAAAYAYHAMRRALGIRLLPFSAIKNSRGIITAFGMMGWAELTANGARSVTGQQFAAEMRSLGVKVCAEPLEERTPDQFWWADH